MPTRFGVQFKLFWCYYTQRRAGRPRSSPRRFAAIVSCADGVFWYINTFPAATVCLSADATAWQSVAYLTITELLTFTV
ncbi:MAG: hypothetical protein LBQ66_05205 [Planctomycetaceae bacterium]|nr:hypothetical protein [Planctomycetaceae bacterium]